MMAFLKRRWVRGTLYSIGATILVLAIVAWWSLRNPPEAMGEIVQPDEDVQIAKLVAASTALSTQDHNEGLKERGDNNWRRDVHGNSPGCITAKFTVSRNAGNLQYGLFAAPASYDAVIRFSNGNHQIKPDTAKDVRGVAIKVLGVPGRKLLESEADAQTQDFVMMNSPVYFFRDLPQYAQFSDMLSWGARSTRAKFLGTWAPSGVMGRDIYPFFNYSWNPLRWNIRSLIQAGKAQVPPPPSPLHIRYYSASAYALGPRFVKYGLRPCDPHYMDHAPKDPTTPDGLHVNLQKTLSQGGWCFEFMVQQQGPNMPVEDASVEWSENVSPFITVARLDIPQQQVPAQQCYCDDLAFNPWHSLPEHRPAGVFNRIRKAVYLESARFRRTHQGTPLVEPATLAEATGGSCPANATGARPQ